MGLIGEVAFLRAGDVWNFDFCLFRHIQLSGDKRFCWRRGPVRLLDRDQNVDTDSDSDSDSEVRRCGLLRRLKTIFTTAPGRANLMGVFLQMCKEWAVSSIGRATDS